MFFADTALVSVVEVQSENAQDTTRVQELNVTEQWKVETVGRSRVVHTSRWWREMERKRWLQRHWSNASCWSTGSGCSREVTAGRITTHKMLDLVHAVDAESKKQVRATGTTSKVGTR